MKTRIFTLIMSLFVATMAFAYDARVDGIYYNLDKENKTAEVTYRDYSYNSYRGNIVIPNSISYDGTIYSVTSIGSSAFYGCSSLTSVTIPNSVTEIENKAFGSSGITSITLGSGISYISTMAFYECNNLTNIHWNIKNCPDFGSGNLFYSSSSYDSFDIRSKIKTFTFGDSVEYIPAHLCDGLTNITSIEIPNSVTSIGGRAFNGCSSLTSITIGNSVTSIGIYAFNGCSSLTSIIIPNSVTWIGDYAFDDCSSLTSVIIPNSVTSIGDFAFDDCSSLSSITIPHNVTSIGYSAFNGCSSLTLITIPNSVTSIGERAFYGCSSLTSVVIGNSVTSIDSYTFCGCSSLTSVIISNSVTSIGKYAFGGCSSLTSVIIPNSVTSIGDFAFDDCSSLSSITIPHNVTSIGSSAFSGCTSLTFVNITAKSVEDYCKNSGINGLLFDQCIEFTKYIDCARKLVINGEEIKDLVIPEGVDIISEESFKNFSNIESVTIPESMTSIRKSAFDACSSLTSIQWNAKKCSDFSHDSRHFGGCVQITSFTFGDNVEYIPAYLCEYREKLTSITIPNSVTKIGQGAFYKCLSLTSIKIPNSVTSIGTRVFTYCEKLRNVEIGSSVETIGNYAFEGCSGIYSLKIGAMIPPIVGAETFADVSRTAQIKVPCGAMAAYQASSYWNEFTNYMESPYTLSVEVNDNTMGMAVVTKQNTCTDITAIVQAQARPGYEFVKWSDGFTENPHTVFVMEDMAITAEFAPMAKEYNVSVVCDATMGIVTGGGTYKEGESIIIEAVANEGYHFVKWSDGNTENPRTIVVVEDIELRAEFELDGTPGDDENYIFIVESADKAQGSVEITITAKAIEGFEFDHWSDGSTENPRVVTLDADVELYAYFRVAETTNVENSVISSANVYGSNGTLYVEGAKTDYHVFDAAGRLIYTGRDAQLSLPRGVYVIAIGGEVEKVVL